MDTTPRTLSSAQTFLMKVVFPPLWIGAFALVTASLFLSPWLWHESSGRPPDPGMKWFFLCWLNIHPVTIEFHADTEFGSRVLFMPKVRRFAFWSSHPVVDEIRAAVNRATGSST